MKDKYYNLTKSPNEGVEDTPPSWMDSLFENKIESEKKSGNPFAGIKDPFLNPRNEGISKKDNSCSKCGCKLSVNEINVCSDCNK